MKIHSGYTIIIKLIVSLLPLFCVQALFPQTDKKEGIISGIVLDGKTIQPIPSATVKIVHIKDSALVTGTLSQKNGKFLIHAELGNYRLQVSFVGYKTFEKKVALTASAPHVKIDSLFLVEDNIILSETIIEAKAPEIIVKGDTIEYNAAAYKVGESAVAEELLKKIPGIEISAAGKITVNGKEIKKIFVDGKEFFSNDPKIASKNLPAQIIDKVQVYEKKSDKEEQTGFKDENGEQSINFVVKQEMKKGWFGNVGAGYGNKKRYSSNLMLNRMVGNDRYTFLGSANNTGGSSMAMENMDFASFGGEMGGGSGVGHFLNGGFNFNNEISEKLNISGHISNNGSNSYLTTKERTETILSSANTLKRQENINNNKYNNFSGNAQMQWQPDTLTTIYLRTGTNLGYNKSNNSSNHITTGSSNDTINYGNSAGLSIGENSSLSGQFSISRQLSGKGRSITLGLSGDVDENHSKNNHQTNIFYKKLGKEELLDQLQAASSQSHQFNGYLSYVEPVGNNIFLEFSYSYNKSNSNQDTDARNKDAEGNYSVLDSRYTRKHVTKSEDQNITVNLRGTRNKISYQTGLDIRPSSNSRLSTMKDSLLNNTQQQKTEYSPNFYLSYELNQRENLSVRYNGRTNHPSLYQLSSVPETSNPLYVTYGNPNLKVAFTNDLNIDYHKFDPETQLFLMLNASFNNTINSIAPSTFTHMETGRQETTYENVNGNFGANLMANINTPLKNKKITLMSATNIHYQNEKGFTNKEINESKNLSLAQMLGLQYNSDNFDLGLNCNFSYNKVHNSLEGRNDQEFMNWGTVANTTIKLPCDFSLGSDIAYRGNKGYTRDFNKNEVLWNAAVSKTLFKKKNGNIEFRIYDVLQQKTNISHNVTANTIHESTSNSLTGYFIFRFTYRFNIFNTNKPTDT